jgi:hypothetical protein
MPWPALAAIALALVGHPVDVRCATVYDWPDTRAAALGSTTRAYTWFDRDHRPTYTLYGPETCGYMVLLVADPNDRLGSKLNGIGTRAREGQAALTFVHELQHQALSSQDEGAVECAAIRALPAVLASIGVRKPGPLLAAARALHFAKPPAYRTVC